MKSFPLFLIAALMVPVNGLLWAQDPRIEQVTVYPDRAEVVRLIQVDLAAGEEELRISDLPARTVPDSLRLSVRSGEGVALGGMELRTVRGAERVQPRARELENRIRALELQRQGLANRIQARNLQLRLLESIVDEDTGQGGDARLEALAEIGSRAEEVLAQRLVHESERDQIAGEMERLKRQLADLGQSQRDTREVLVPVRAEGPGRAEIDLTYLVSDAGWESLYEWRLDTEAARLVLVQQARVRQNTGEDWTDARIQVALGQPALGGQLPQLRPWTIDIARPAPRARMLESAAMDAAPLAGAPESMLQGSEMAAMYRIPGRNHVSGDNAPRRFLLAEHVLEGQLGARAVPRRQTRAWLFFEAQYDGEAWLPPGRVALFQDGAVVGQTRFTGLAPGGALAESFGVAERIEIDHRLVRDTRGSEGLVRRANRLEREFEFEVSNRYGRALEILIIDQLPVPGDERIEVEMTADSRRPDVLDFNDQAGVVAWRDEYQPGQTRRFRFGYRAVFPRDVEGLSGW